MLYILISIAYLSV